MTIEDGGGEIEEGVSSSTGNEGRGSAGGGVGACGGEEAVGRGEVLIAPASVVSSRKFGEFAEPHFMEVGAGERFKGWVGGSVVADRRGCRAFGMKGVIIRGVQGPKGRYRGGNGRGKSHWICSSHGAAELSSVDKG